MRQRTVSDSFWRDPDISEQDLSLEDKITLLYFLTSPFSNIIGVYRIVWSIAASEMGWTKDQMVTVAKRLQLKGLIASNDAGFIWVKIWWKHNSAKGAFSPKLLGNAKKQCAEMPAEWLEEYLKSLESVGVDRVSIGYQYPDDTPFPNTTGISNFITTTTTSAGELIFSSELSEHEKNSIIGLMPKIQFLPLQKQQELLDELAGAINTKSIKTNPVSFFNGLITAAKRGPFIPGRGVKVLEARSVPNSNKATMELRLKDKDLLDQAAMEKGAKMIRVPGHIRLQQ